MSSTRFRGKDAGVGTVSAPDPDAEKGPAQAERTGRAEAEIVDLRNLLEESLAREQHWMERALRVERTAQEAAYTEEQRTLWRAICLEDEIEKQRAEAETARERALAAEQTAAELETRLRFAEQTTTQAKDLESRLHRETERSRSAEKTATAASLAAKELESRLARETDRSHAAEQAAATASSAAKEVESRLRRETERSRSAEQAAAAASSQAETLAAKLDEAEERLRRTTADAIAKSQALEASETELAGLRRDLAAERTALQSAGARAQTAEDALAEAQRHLERYAAFHRALEKSSGWRIIQGARRLLGGKW